MAPTEAENKENTAGEKTNTLNPAAPEFVPKFTSWKPNPNATPFQPTGESSQVQTLDLASKLPQPKGKGKGGKGKGDRTKDAERQKREEQVEAAIVEICKKYSEVWKESDFDWRSKALMTLILKESQEAFGRCVENEFWGQIHSSNDGKPRDHFRASGHSGGGAKKYIWAWLRKEFPSQYAELKGRLAEPGSDARRGK